MTKRIVVAGCRDYNNYIEAKMYMDFCISKIKNEHELIFVSGGCRGADRLGERFAKENGIKIEIYPADWEHLGKSAGPVRNKQMEQAADYAICFWDRKSKGTLSLITLALEKGIPLRAKYING